MKRLIYTLALLLLTIMPVAAQNVISEAKSFNIYYNSLDGQKNKVNLSAVVYVPKKETFEIRHILLNCHPTVTSNFEAPSGVNPVDGDISRMCGFDGDSYMVVCPDYCGYGISSYLQHPYLIHDVTAQNCIDAVLAAIEEAKAKGINIASNYTTDIVGYSQGGATALACAKYLDSSMCPMETKNKINLRQTTCGDGPYSAVKTVEQYLAWGIPGQADADKNLEYPCVLPLIVAAAKEAYDDGCMHSVEVESFFTEDFLATGVLNLLTTKVTSTVDLNKIISDAMSRRRPVDVFSSKIINPDGTFNTTTNEYKCLMRALSIGDLSKGWTPTHTITFYHLEGDGVVPYANFKAIQEGIMAELPEVKKDLVRYVSPSQSHQSGLTDNLLNYISAMKGLDNPDYTTIDHANGGTLFYIDYIFGDNLRVKN